MPSTSGNKRISKTVYKRAIWAFMALLIHKFEGYLSQPIVCSLAGYTVKLLVRILPFTAGYIPQWLAGGGLSLLGGLLSVNLLAPLILVALTLLLCQVRGKKTQVGYCGEMSWYVMVRFVFESVALLLTSQKKATSEEPDRF